MFRRETARSDSRSRSSVVELCDQAGSVNMALPLAVADAGTSSCITSQCSTSLPSRTRKISTATSGFSAQPTALIARNRGWQMKHKLGVGWGTPSSAVVDVLLHTVGPLRRSLFSEHLWPPRCPGERPGIVLPECLRHLVTPNTGAKPILRGSAVCRFLRSLSASCHINAIQITAFIQHL